MATKKLYQVRLVNVQTIGARCGWGCGETHEQAIAKALEIARERDEAAFYDKQSGTVCFAGGINC